MDSAATAKADDSLFKTPRPNRVRSLHSSGSSPGTPITIPASPFMKKLGCGTGVNVYLLDRAGKLNASPWAVKKINRACALKQLDTYQKRLNEEIEVLRGLKHPNIIGFRAVAKSSDGSQCLAMEYGGEQSLFDLIEDRQGKGLGAFPPDTIEKVALHVARGLQYLHNEKKLLHGDIKSCNVVIQGNFETVKICDVGMCLQLDENMRVADPEAQYVGTEPWMPKEALEDTEGGEITDKADMYAYGLTLWEMMTLSMPHLEILDEEDDDDDDDGNDEDESMEDFNDDEYYARLGSRPLLDAEALGPAYRRVVELFWLCSDQEPKNRPSAAQVVQALENQSSLENMTATENKLPLGRNPLSEKSHSEVIVID